MVEPMAAVVTLAPPDRGWLRDALRRLLRNRAAVVGIVIIGIFVLMALLAPWIDRHPPTDQHLDATLSGPSARFWLGTDQLGRDQYSRLIHGARVSLTVGVPTPKHWPLFCAALERPDLLTDERSESPFARADNRDWLHAELATQFKTATRQHWLDALIEQDVPCGPIYDYAGVVAEPQFWENDYLIELDHPNFEGHRTVGIPLMLSETPGRVQGPAPEL
ncbi:MAG: CoA transferase, partial [Chloroflexi bacterium]|nr:CoA transferase [Chloroflexota bacterium]